MEKRYRICPLKTHVDLHADLHAARHRAVQIDRGFYCKSNLHSNASDDISGKVLDFTPPPPPQQMQPTVNSTSNLHIENASVIVM
jgi:hypothetical protein